MAELIPAPFVELLTRLYEEARVEQSIFALPRKKWFVPESTGPDLSVRFHGRLAGNPSGPAAGPQTQMAQNLLLSYVAGGRILELKTVQVNDRLKIPRPCIDATNIGYNVEWSQELLVEQSLREYVAGKMLIEVFRRDPEFGVADQLSGRAGEIIYDLSVGYDLAGIRSDKVQRFLDGMRDASCEVESLRSQMPAKFKLARGLDYPRQISNSLTLSTFHGCPVDEIERICEFLIAERGLDVVVKMNPPMLGKERLEHLLHDELGYDQLRVNPSAYTSGLRFDEGVQLVDRLKRFAADRGRGFGCKFSNTLEVLNHRTFFTTDNQVQYLSGQPLHVITMTLTDIFRRAIGAEIPISFSAGIDKHNFASSVACGFVPVTVCTDLLRTGGYGRLSAYMPMLAEEMRKVGADTIDDFILNAYGARDAGVKNVHEAGLRSNTIVAQNARHDPRYRAAQNRKVPPRIDSHLRILDCITCEKCVPVCPNAAIFMYPTPKGSFEYHDLIVGVDRSIELGEKRTMNIREAMQIGVWADFCNECGNCDTFCPEKGGPYKEKPGVYGTIESWQAASPRDGLIVFHAPDGVMLRARLDSTEYRLAIDRSSGMRSFTNDIVSIVFDANDRALSATRSQADGGRIVVSLDRYYLLLHILNGLLDRTHVNPINMAAEVASAI